MISVQCGSQLSGVSHSVLGTLLPVCLREVPPAPRALPRPVPAPQPLLMLRFLCCGPGKNTLVT